MSLTPEQLSAIREVNAEMRQLEADGAWTQDAFVRLVEKMKAIAPDHGDVTSTLYRHADPNWIRRRSTQSNAA